MPIELLPAFLWHQSHSVFGTFFFHIYAYKRSLPYWLTVISREIKIKVIESWKGLGWKASRAAEFPKEEQSALITRGRQPRVQRCSTAQVAHFTISWKTP